MKCSQCIAADVGTRDSAFAHQSTPSLPTRTFCNNNNNNNQHLVSNTSIITCVSVAAFSFSFFCCFAVVSVSSAIYLYESNFSISLDKAMDAMQLAAPLATAAAAAAQPISFTYFNLNDSTILKYTIFFPLHFHVLALSRVRSCTLLFVFLLPFRRIENFRLLLDSFKF